VSERNNDNLIGTVIAGKYELIRVLGTGGMGAVYEGRNASTLKRVAVKILYEELGRDEGVVKRFFREAQASSIIESDYIVTIYDSGTDTTLRFPYMVMEMLQGEDLEQVVARLGPLDPLVVAKMMLQTTMGLGKAHDNGITHRDIKPANLYLTTREDGDCILKILDFGIAKIRAEKFSDQSSAGLTATGSVLGTPLYMSPEQARGLSTVDARSDVWSLGVVMFELLSGRVPYTEAGTLGDLIVAIVTADLPLLQDRAPWVPPELAEITHRAMSRDLEKRFKSATEMRDALAALVPDGPRFTKLQLKSVDPSIQTIVAPRLELSQGMLKAVVRTGLAMTSTPAVKPKAPPPKSSLVTITTLAVGAVALAGVGFAALRYSHANSAAESVAPPTPPPVVAAAAVAPAPVAAPAGAQMRSFQLVVLPSDVVVTVDGQPTTVRDEAIMITGAPGTTKTVRVAKGGKEGETIVAITENGLVPPKVQLALATPVPPGGHAHGPAKPTVTPATTPPAENRHLVTDTNEFQ
jgi:serine/threonine-protein kinase